MNKFLIEIYQDGRDPKYLSKDLGCTVEGALKTCIVQFGEKWPEGLKWVTMFMDISLLCICFYVFLIILMNGHKGQLWVKLLPVVSACAMLFAMVNTYQHTRVLEKENNSYFYRIQNETEKHPLEGVKLLKKEQP